MDWEHGCRHGGQTQFKTQLKTVQESVLLYEPNMVPDAVAEKMSGHICIK